MMPPDSPILFAFEQTVLVEMQVTVESGGKIERTHPGAWIFSISTRSARFVPCVTCETALGQTLLSDIYTMYD
jgi:hypothetical protein